MTHASLLSTVFVPIPCALKLGKPTPFWMLAWGQVLRSSLISMSLHTPTLPIFVLMVPVTPQLVLAHAAILGADALTKVVEFRVPQELRRPFKLVWSSTTPVTPPVITSVATHAIARLVVVLAAPTVRQAHSVVCTAMALEDVFSCPSCFPDAA
jgi:hypothetical protein